MNNKDYHSKSIEETLLELNSSIEGLTKQEVKNRINKYGKNEIPKAKQESIAKIFLGELINPMEIILMITVVLSFLIGEVVDAITLLIIILVDVCIGTVEQWQARKDAESLINMIKVMVHVVRNGENLEIESSDLVVGDIITLESGDKISADARIIECHNFQVDESALTGESLAVLKEYKELPEDTLLNDRINMVYAGTSVITGRCMAIVTSTGLDTEIGKIANTVTNTEEEKSPLTIRMEKFTKQIGIMIIAMAIIITIILIFKQYKGGDILLNVIALSVSAMPEGLSLALTMALTIASKRMAKKNVIVKKLNSVESLGSCTVIASDKTGTLTVNEQTAKEIILANGKRYTISGTGYNDEGEVIQVDNAPIEKAEYIAWLGFINNEAHLEKSHKEWKFFGDSIDIAFLSLAKKMNVAEKPQIVEMIPYESENQYSAVFYKKDGKLRCTVKGALEKIMSFSQKKDIYKEQNNELTGKGYRVIAIADGEVKDTSKESIKKLDMIGLVAFIDPIRKEVKKSIKECETAGIKVVMITGDHPLTAYAIGKELNICHDESEVATGQDIEKYRNLGEEEFDQFVSCIRVFSRVTPLDKLAIVNSYKRQGEFVAVTGDGVNDAPAIKSANIGIAMGSGTDVAKETASMIITNDNFTSIVEGVKEGRTAYNNIRKIILFLIGCGVAEVAFFLLSIIFGYDIPLMAIQLLWLNIVTDGLQDIALSFEKEGNDVMKEKPRSTKESLFSKDLVVKILILGTTITLVVFAAWKYLMDKGTDIVEARSIIMMLMVFIQNINVLNCRSEKNSVFRSRILTNPLIPITVVGSILLQIIMAEIPITADFLNVTPLPVITIVKIFVLSLSIIVVFEIYKLILNSLNKSKEAHNNVD